MFDRDFGLQIPGKPFGYLSGQPVLSYAGLEKTVKQEDKQHNAE